MSLKVYRVPVGATLRDSFCQELQQLAYGSAALLLPTGLLQNQVKHAYNVEVSSFDTLANKILNLNGFAYLEEINYRSQQLVVKETLDYYAEAGQFEYLAGLKDKRGFVKHMTGLLTQLSRSGATEEELSNALTSWGREGNLGRKDREVALVYRGYRNMLKLQNRFDLEGKYRLALKILREQESPRLPWQAIYVSDFATLDALQLELLQELAKHCDITVGLCYEKAKATCAVSQTTIEGLEKNVPAVTAGGSALVRPKALQHLVASLGAEEISKIDNDGSLLVREYKHQQAEIKGVLAEIKAEVLAGASLADYAVVVYDLSNYRGLRLIADAYGIPLTLPKAEQLLVQPLTEFLVLLLKAVSDNRQGVDAYFALLESSLGKLLFDSSLEKLSKLREECFYRQRSSLQAAVAAELETKPQLLEQVDGFIASCKAKDTVAGFSEAIAGFIGELSLAKKLGALYKQEDISLAGLQSMLQTEKQLLDSLRSLTEDYAKCNMAGERYSLQEFALIWQEGLAEAGLTVDMGRKDGLLVTNAVQLQGTSYKKVYLLGLREGEFPAGNRENWLYNDKERGELQSMGVALPNTFDAYAADYCLFAGVTAVATERLVLSFYKDDEGEESPYIDEVQNLFNDLKIDLLEEQKVASVAEALEDSTSCEQQWLEEQAGALTLEAAQVDKARAGVYNGALEAKELLEGLQEGSRTRFSASSLGQYVDCPFRYLGTQVWGQRDQREKSEQLDGGTRGSLFHETVADFVAAYLQGKPSGDAELLWQRLMEIYTAKVEQFQKEGKISANEYWEVESHNMERLLAWWLSYELAEQSLWEGFSPVALEQDFGSSEQVVRLETENKEAVYLKGRIDRIDASETGVFVTDYKSGAAPGDSDFAKGRDLQMAFYLLAAEKLCPGKEILGGNYLSLKAKGRQGGVAWKTAGNLNIKVTGKKNAPTYTSWAEVKEACEAMVLEPVTELYKGNFAVAPEEGACQYCPLKDICRYNVLEQQAENKEVNQDGQAGD